MSLNWPLMLWLASMPRSIASVSSRVCATPLETASCMASTICSISMVASADWSARRRISRATTANPAPPSPAFSASMAAFRLRRLVWSATLVMAVTTELILLALVRMVVSLSVMECVAEDSDSMDELSPFSPWLPWFATVLVFSASSASSSIARRSSFEVAEISFTAVAIWLPEVLMLATFAACWREFEAMDVAFEVSRMVRSAMGSMSRLLSRSAISIARASVTEQMRIVCNSSVRNSTLTLWEASCRSRESAMMAMAQSHFSK